MFQEAVHFALNNLGIRSPEMLFTTLSLQALSLQAVVAAVAMVLFAADPMTQSGSVLQVCVADPGVVLRVVDREVGLEPAGFAGEVCVGTIAFNREDNEQVEDFALEVAVDAAPIVMRLLRGRGESPNQPE